ncbi:MAG TPA: MauE/DoxX family redox-associated membrane protein [Cyclobacteriaceae bacterium]|jgi:uncharacterized membrane protein YphA (DoxX/SURF4 family)|nr:MauE/DoxX family redox-associated membrane protein [Cyclobacteriaceae bacterium]
MMVEIISCLLVVLFVYAAVSKLMDMEQFGIQLGQSPLVTSFSNVLIVAVPAVEIITAICLAVPAFRLIGLYAGFSLMALFTFYIVAILHLDSNIPCSCGGILEAMGWREHLIFNIIFSLIALTGVLVHPVRTEALFKSGK